MLSVPGLCHDFGAQITGSGGLVPPLYSGFCHTGPIIDSPLFLYLISFSASPVSQISFMYHLTRAYTVKAQLLYSPVHLHFMFVGNNCILRTIQQEQNSCCM